MMRSASMHDSIAEEVLRAALYPGRFDPSWARRVAQPVSWREFAFCRRSQNEGAPLRAVFAGWVARLVSGTFVGRRMSDLFLRQIPERESSTSILPTL